MNDKIYNSIIESAEKLFNRFGIGKTAVSDVADMADVSRATIFNNFGNKDGLIEAVLQHKADDFSHQIKKRVNSSDTAAQQIKIILLERLKLLRSLKFLTDKRIRYSNKSIEKFILELNEIFKHRVWNILQHMRGGDLDHKSMLNSIFFMLRGIEQGLFDHIEPFQLSGIEKDMDFFLKQMFKGEKEGGSS
ncbi:MAG: helix-turn-helix transcriptional regulator [Spirochaetales bacterium]|nr:helix-turn-helix transcriptional regulator [Spirochaetales bacterium]